MLTKRIKLERNGKYIRPLIALTQEDMKVLGIKIPETLEHDKAMTLQPVHIFTADELDIKPKVTKENNTWEGCNKCGGYSGGNKLCKLCADKATP